jgi:C-terminal processing protease CtpA/Prc
MGLEAPYDIVLRDATGAIVEIKDAGIPAQRKRRTFERISADDEAGDQGSAAAKPAADPWSFRWVGDASGEDIGLLTWDSMSLGTEVAWAKELDRVFTELESRKARGLIVDIRANGGGNSENGALLLESVSDNPYRGASGKLWKRSRPYDAFVEACLVWWARILPWRSFMGIGDLDLGEQRWFAKDVPPSNDPDLKRRFNGPVALLVGPGTFSSANMTADMAKSYKMALLVGRPTGEPVNSIGECGFAQLPNSGLIVSFCTAYFLGAAGDPENGGPVEPDILVPDDDGGARAIEVAIQALRERNATPR